MQRVVVERRDDVIARITVYKGFEYPPQPISFQLVECFFIRKILQ